MLPLTATPDLGDNRPPTIPKSAQQALSLVTSPPSHPTLESQIDLLLSNTQYLPVLQAVRRIFNDLVRLLECLRLMEDNLHQVRETLALLDIIRSDTLALLDFTENEALHMDGTSERLYEVLDGMSFALRHEVRRVFEENLGESATDEPTEVTHAKFADTHRVLTNCLQQSIITLAQVFDPRLDGRSLFDNSKARLKQSLILCKDLWTLVKLVRRAQRSLDENSLGLVLERVKEFRNDSMRHLMYRDWGNFERLAQELDSAAREKLDCGPLLHQFLCYIETLLGQVRLRGVLTELMPDVLSNQLDDQDDHLDWGCEELRLTFELYMAG